MSNVINPVIPGYSIPLCPSRHFKIHDIPDLHHDKEKKGGETRVYKATILSNHFSKKMKKTTACE